MRIIEPKRKTLAFVLLFGVLFQAYTQSQEQSRPKGLMLNLNFQQATDGLIPSKTLYPLYIPQGELKIESTNHRNMLALQYGQGLDIPHSSLLDPDGNDWIVSLRVFALTDGLILSQVNDQYGFVIYLKDGTVQACLRTPHSSITLKERADRGITKRIKKWVSIELQIKDDVAILSLNRQRVSMAPLQAPLKGGNMHIRIGHHQKLPIILKNKQGIPQTGFTGAISSLKVFRQ